MSLFCFFVFNMVEDKEINILKQEIKTLATQYDRDVNFFVDWSEPILSCIDINALVVNVLDSPKSNNCDFLLLPDDWYINGLTNSMDFKERMKFLQEIAQLMITKKCCVDVYLGQSGLLPEEYIHFTIKVNELIDFLQNTIGVGGIVDGMHIRLIL